jgi:hypothetical protein
MPFALTDHQLVMAAAALLDSSKRVNVRSGQCFGQWSVSLVSAVSGFSPSHFHP